MPRGVVRCQCVDLSNGGLLVLSPKSARPRQRAFVETNFGGHAFHLPAVVVRRKRTRGGYLLGLRFTEIDERLQATLDEVVRAMQVQSVLAQQAYVFFERLPQLEAPEGEAARPGPPPGPPVGASHPPMPGQPPYVPPSPSPYGSVADSSVPGSPWAESGSHGAVAPYGTPPSGSHPYGTHPGAGPHLSLIHI